MPVFASTQEVATGIRRVLPDGTEQAPRSLSKTAPEAHNSAVSRQWAEYRHHTPADIEKMLRIRSSAIAMMDTVGACTRVCADQAVAMRKIREAIHAAEDAILLDRRVSRRIETVP